MRHSRFLSYIYIICVVLFTTGCADEVGLDDYAWFPSKTPQTITVSSDNLSFPHEGSSQTVSVVSDMDWTIVEKPNFVTISPMRGGKGTTMITISATANNTNNHLNGNISIGVPSHPSIKRNILVEQKQNPTRAFTVGDVTFNMILVEHGTFQMGSDDSEAGDSERPVHSVTISKDYYIGETEVTQGLWYAVMGQKPMSDGDGWCSLYGLGNNYPAYYISWDDCQEFIMRLNQMTGLTFRMPTEAEWEFAARGGNKSLGYKYSGSNTIDDVAWYYDNSVDKGSSSMVATKLPNELGIYDMTGNVDEWCSDWFSSYSSSAVTDPTGPSTVSFSRRVIRGGGWAYFALFCHSTFRAGQTPTYRGNCQGFRLAL